MYLSLRIRVALATILWLFVLPVASADEFVDTRDVVGHAMRMFTSSSLSDTILTAAKSLFVSLAAISLVWTMAALILRQDIGELLMELLRFIIVSGTFYWLLVNASTHQGGGGFVEDITASFLQMANDDASNPSTELIVSKGNDVMSRGLTVFYAVVMEAGEGSDADRLLTGLMGLAILCICAVLAAQFLLALVMAWVLGYAGIFLLGFGGARWTSPIAINFYKHVVAVGAALLVLSFIGKIAAKLLTELKYKSPSVSDTLVTFPYLGLMLAVSILMVILSLKLPQLIYTLVTGSTLGLYAGSASAAGTAIGAASSSVMAAAAGRFPDGGSPSRGSASEATTSYRTDSVMDAVHRSAITSGGMSDPFHATGSSDPFGVTRSQDPHRAPGGGSVFSRTQGAGEDLPSRFVSSTLVRDSSHVAGVDTGPASAVPSATAEPGAHLVRHANTASQGRLEPSFAGVAAGQYVDAPQANGTNHTYSRLRPVADEEVARQHESVMAAIEGGKEPLDMPRISEQVGSARQDTMPDDAKTGLHISTSAPEETMDLSTSHLSPAGAVEMPRIDEQIDNARQDTTLDDGRMGLHAGTPAPDDTVSLSASHLSPAGAVDMPRIDEQVDNARQGTTLDDGRTGLYTGASVPEGTVNLSMSQLFPAGAVDMPRIDEQVGSARQDTTLDDAKTGFHASTSAPENTVSLSASHLSPAGAVEMPRIDEQADNARQDTTPDDAKTGLHISTSAPENTMNLPTSHLSPAGALDISASHHLSNGMTEGGMADMVSNEATQANAQPRQATASMPTKTEDVTGKSARLADSGQDLDTGTSCVAGQVSEGQRETLVDASGAELATTPRDTSGFPSSGSTAHDAIDAMWSPIEHRHTARPGATNDGHVQGRSNDARQSAMVASTSPPIGTVIQGDMKPVASVRDEGVDVLPGAAVLPATPVTGVHDEHTGMPEASEPDSPRQRPGKPHLRSRGDEQSTSPLSLPLDAVPPDGRLSMQDDKPPSGEPA
ncbi:P-type conjugative transfer protein TrbL [Luteibacter yeojuensis]|uniref:P-type conjugative transfer protein TrbL n=1 Tax=Luteibacter yeojuensis TaxID=345309 RepID=A0A7X5TQS5_9GAMM|nr:P-type conjugative transfer protein TrbL [Luteibacter yeojuensis]NID16415.1 P-type conjugative transfer protein TrbL [Luteibacter yeojuensis]